MTKTAFRVGDTIDHNIYGDGEIVAIRGLFVRVKFRKDLPGILTRNGARRNELTVGLCACS